MARFVQFVLTVAVATVLGACGTIPKAPAAPAKVSGDLLVSSDGMTLYIFDQDKDGKSACNGKCLFNWPPVLVTGEAAPSGNWAIIDRDDGLRQWAYKGKPVYTFEKDKKAGDKLGDGVNGAWHVAKP